MHKILLLLISFILSATLLQGQTREELEKQRQQLRKEIEQTTKLLNANKLETKENFLQWSLINNKVELQNKVVENLSKDVHVLDNNIYTMQLDINKYNRQLDTLKKEYATSMVYAYKNRSNYDFLNFIFAADNFNDAIKRIAYLKSYRTYRENQGQNIVRTQTLLLKKINALGNAKVSKTVTLRTQSQEREELATQKGEKDRILNELKKQGKDLNGQIAAKQKQMKKVDAVIASAIRKAISDAKKEALAKATAEEKIRKENQRLADKKVADALAIKRADEARLAAEKKNNPATTAPPTSPIASVTPAPVKTEIKPAVVKAPAPIVAKEKPGSVLLNPDNIALNASFERNRGSLPWPVDKGNVLMHYGKNSLPSGGDLVNACTTISAAIGSNVKSVFDGVVVAVQNIDNGVDAVVVQHGKYFTTYANINGVVVKPDDQVRTGQILGKVASGIDGGGAVDFYIQNENSNYDPEGWLRK